ncbi:taurine ABC transporter substrate-binding protein [Pseudomonas solani]|uniref:Taurine ABC transporter substrate-binding protein n=1 Tax=Pseudomonas solani TaxID=2731552 RepID=A0ABM7L8U1_9PSED|nr:MULTISPECIES: ABC transporter substrate-binding protein [Pseudomonas]EQM70416.1 taurine ABC transporter substrate-binding protein [Pseudomonas alcaligenes OT 69]MDN4143746.1 ABC transporter substrate-binding protein [Pseudomonas tohonis]MDU9411069.1 ABC transporter substrate-binding protein [Pseudomonas sp. zfem005]BCD85916.1 taurine ABC transporter substrate-binding protein [Pseudomonas solani]
MIKSLLRRFTLPLTCTALAVGAAGAQAGTLSIGHTTWVGYGTLYLARDLGYFKELGLDLELTTIEEASMYMAAQASGKLSGSASTIDEVLKYRSKDFCFKAVAALDESYGGDGVLVGKEVTSLKDLKGQSVAVNEGSVSQFWLSYLLKHNGMTMADLDIQNMTADDAATAFIAGRVPAAVTWEPHLSLVRQKGEGKVLVDSSTTPGVIVDVVALSCDVIDKQPEDVKALVKGLYKAVQFTQDNPEKAHEIMAKGVGGYLADPVELANAAKGVRFYDQAMSEKLLGVPGKPGDIKGVIRLANETWSALQGKRYEVSYDDLVDTRFVSQ